MMKFLCLSIAILATAMIAKAKQNVIWFEAEHQKIYKIQGCIPFSDIGFYSDKGGGRLLELYTVNLNGTFTLNKDSSFKPAMIVSLTQPNGQGFRGNGKVNIIDLPEFTIQNATIKTQNNQSALSWISKVNAYENISFSIYKSIDGIKYDKICIIKPYNDSVSHEYTYTDNKKENEIAFYKVEVVNNNEGSRYMTKVLSSFHNDQIICYPNVTENLVNIVLPMEKTNVNYHIIDASGKVIKQGILSEKTSTISLGSIAPGLYYFSTTGAEKSIKIIKR